MNWNQDQVKKKSFFKKFRILLILQILQKIQESAVEKTIFGTESAIESNCH